MNVDRALDPGPAFVDEFYMRPEFCSQGFGRKALHQMAEHCARHGTRSVHLEVEHANPRVHRLYKREGFEDRGFYILSKRIRFSSQDEKLTISEQGEGVCNTTR